jgi:hypothetical protein
MGTVRFITLCVAVTLVVGCNEDNTLGLGNSKVDRYTATLSGTNMRPVPIATSATATAEISIREPEVGTTTQTLAFTLSASNLTNATAAHIHLGGAAVSGGQILATLFTNPSDTALTATQIAAGSLAGSALAVSLDSLATLMRVGAAYVDIHTTANPTGLIRGQLTLTGQQAPGDIFVARSLTGAKERPTPVVSSATGSATFELLSGGTIRFNVTVAGLTGATMAHIHTGVADSAGPIAVTLFNSTTPTGPLTGALASGTFSSGNIVLPGINLDSLLSLMRLGRTYVNVHTALNPAGEIRAQIEPASAIP